MGAHAFGTFNGIGEINPASALARSRRQGGKIACERPSAKICQQINVGTVFARTAADDFYQIVETALAVLFLQPGNFRCNSCIGLARQ